MNKMAYTGELRGDWLNFNNKSKLIDNNRVIDQKHRCIHGSEAFRTLLRRDGLF